MEEQSDGDSALSLASLVKQHPDLTPLVADILDVCRQDNDKAYEMLCEMVIPSEPAQNNQGSAAFAYSSPLKPTQTVSAEQVEERPEYTSIFQSSYSQISFESPSDAPAPKSSLDDSSSKDNALPENNTSFKNTLSFQHSPRASSQPMLQGAWAQKSMGRTFRVDDLCDKYEWISRNAVEGLLDKYDDCLELVETDILEMFPIDEPQAFGGGHNMNDNKHGPMSQSKTYAQNATAKRGTPDRRQLRQKAIADSLRQQAIDQIQQDSQISQSISVSSSGMNSLRAELWDTRVNRMQWQQLANQTRKPSHIANAKAQDAELQRLSTDLLHRMRKSEEYKKGVIDLHGLTKEEALQLVEWKLRDSGRRRFKLITGKGTHSHNGHAVLRPALERYFRTKGITVSVVGDDILQIVP
ncbi:unnamed protein product [Chondrus crispus]|uniref:Smr domain-containing protein n=1 Tax=Chondrus crispus TaxID=2769 RepID=R7QBV1_CHOCR|nr:unnamed protein product [Chondrus crispus]CDF35524.1 unnamed protein product [Chondrus crispus]|eukprot:XP_005715343.1 unnamed protein product [Chondrus crispus]